MKQKLYLLLALALPLFFTACQEPEGDLSYPQIEISLYEASAQMQASSFTVELTSNRAWKAVSDVPWIAIDPESGAGSDKPQKVEITVQENKSWNRSGKVIFDIVYDNMTINVTQEGNGSPEDYIIYTNDFDKETATQAYGSSKSSWPYLDQFDGWKNQSGVGVAGLSYEFANVSARNNSNSNGSYSDYEGSGLNNLLFGNNGFIKIKDLELKDFTDFELSFGSEKYLNDDKTALFNVAEMPVYASCDGAKWVPVTYEYTGTAAGRWNIARGTFSVPAGTEKLSLYIGATVASAYRLDDLKLIVSETPGTVLDFSNGIDLPSGGNDSGSGGGSSDYDNAPAKTVQDFIGLADGSNYYKLTGKVSGFNPTYCSFDLTDETGKIYVYSVDNKDQWSSKISNGGTVTLAGKYMYYSNKSQHEVVNAQILSFTAGGSDDTGGGTGDIKYERMDPNAVKEGVYAIAYTTGGSTYLMKNEVKASYYVAATAFDLSAGKAPSNDYLFTVKKSGNGYTIQNAAGGYVGVEVSGTHYNLKPSLSTPYVWSFSAGSNGAVVAKGDNSGDNCMSFNASYTEFSMYKGTDSCPTFYLIDNAGENTGDDTGGEGSEGGSGNDGSTVTWTVGLNNQKWNGVTDPNFGAGFSATAAGMTVSYFKDKSTTAPTVAKDDHIRVYKGSRFEISVAGCTNITSVELTCISAGSTKYCYDLTLTDGTKATADTDAMKVRWSGSKVKFEANSLDGQIRVSAIKVTYE